MTRNDGTHGARPLRVLMSLFLAVTLLVAAAGAVWLVVSLPLWWPDAPRIGLPVQLAMEFPEDLITITSEIGPIETGTWRGAPEIRFDDAWAQWFYVLSAIGQVLLVALILHRMRRVVDAFARREALTRSAARDLRWAGGLMVVESLVAPLIAMFVASLALKGIASPDVALGIDYVSDAGRNGFISGWVLIILSAALGQGAELRDEQSLTV